MTKLENGKYIFKTSAYPGHALKYDSKAKQVIVGKYDADNITLEFKFLLKPTPKPKLFPFICL